MRVRAYNSDVDLGLADALDGPVGGEHSGVNWQFGGLNPQGRIKEDALVADLGLGTEFSFPGVTWEWGLEAALGVEEDEFDFDLGLQFEIGAEQVGGWPDTEIWVFGAGVVEPVVEEDMFVLVTEFGAPVMDGTGLMIMVY